MTPGPNGKNGNMFFCVYNIIQINLSAFAKILYEISSSLIFVSLADILFSCSCEMGLVMWFLH